MEKDNHSYKMMEYFKNVCLETKKLSTCISKQVGAILIREDRIIAIGYNGVPAGEKHCNEIFSFPFDREEHIKWSSINEYHAEENIFAFCLRNGISTINTEIIISLSPCINCARMIKNSGVKKVFYIDLYDRDQEGIKFLEKNNIPIQQI
jgi:dCMP deaminase